jgi:hypothetical protein
MKTWIAKQNHVRIQKVPIRSCTKVWVEAAFQTARTHLQRSCKSTRAKTLASATDQPEVHINSTIGDVLRILKSNLDVFLVRGCPSPASDGAELIRSRKTFLRCALASGAPTSPRRHRRRALQRSALARGDDSVVSLLLRSGGEVATPSDRMQA